MNRKFGGGRPPTGTPSLAWSSVVVVLSLLAGASIVHNLYKPDLVLYFQHECLHARCSTKCFTPLAETLPPVDGVTGTNGKQPEKE